MLDIDFDRFSLLARHIESKTGVSYFTALGIVMEVANEVANVTHVETLEEAADRIVLANPAKKITCIKYLRDWSKDNSAEGDLMGLLEAKNAIEAAYDRLSKQGKIVKDYTYADGYGEYRLS